MCGLGAVDDGVVPRERLVLPHATARGPSSGSAVAAEAFGHNHGYGADDHSSRAEGRGEEVRAAEGCRAEAGSPEAACDRRAQRDRRPQAENGSGEARIQPDDDPAARDEGRGEEVGAAEGRREETGSPQAAGDRRAQCDRRSQAEDGSGEARIEAGDAQHGADQTGDNRHARDERGSPSEEGSQ